MAARHEAYRIHTGDARVVYLIDDDILPVPIVRVRHRRMVDDRR
jgi:mRNA-degrading endonuclease RelE of RelBE toxin-antitoxin system